MSDSGEAVPGVTAPVFGLARDRWPRCFGRILLGLGVCLAGFAGLNGCGSGESETVGLAPTETTQPWAPYCVESLAFVEFLEERQVELFDPAQAEGFLESAIAQLDTVGAVVPPDVQPAVNGLRQAYQDLDDSLAAVDYDVAALDESTLSQGVDMQASLDFDDFLVDQCGLGVSDLRPPGPEALSDEELDELRQADSSGSETLSPAEVREILASELAAVLGVTEEEARCVVDEMPEEMQATIAAGETLSGVETQSFVELLSTCGLEP